MGETLPERQVSDLLAAVALLRQEPVIGAVAVLVPPVVTQLTQLVTLFQAFAKSPPDFAGAAQTLVTRLGLHIDVQSALVGVLGNVQSVATSGLQNAVIILGGVLSLIANLLLVLLLSFFFALDGPRLFRGVFELVPAEYESEVQMLAATVDRTFGGFIRAQLLQSLLIGIGTALVTALFGEPFVLVASLFAAFFMLIPFVGAFLALVPPLLTTLFHSPDHLFIVLAILLVYQLAIVNVVMPKLLSEALGLHPLIILGSLLLGTKSGGFWGAFFAVPVAGVIATMALFFYRRWARPLPSLVTAAPPAGAAPPVSAAPPRRPVEREKI